MSDQDTASVAETTTIDTTPPAVGNDTDTSTVSMDDTLEKAWDSAQTGNDRGEGGKFVSKNPEQAAEAPPEQNADQAAEKAVEQAPPAIDAPISWSAEQKAKWASVPPDLQAYIAQRDKESHDAITRAGQQVKAFEPIRNVVEQFAHVFQKNGLQPHDGIARMMAVNEMLEANPRAAIEQIARAYGVNLQGNAEHDASPENPRIAELEARLARQESQLTARMRQEQEAQEAALAREIADFAKDKPHFEGVRRVMAGLMTSGAAETMQDAYDMAVYADPKIRERIQADQRAAEEAKAKEAKAKQEAEAKARAEEARKSGKVNVRSGTAIPNPKTMDDTLEELARRAYG